MTILLGLSLLLVIAALLTMGDAKGSDPYAQTMIAVGLLASAVVAAAAAVIVVVAA